MRERLTGQETWRKRVSLTRTGRPMSIERGNPGRGGSCSSASIPAAEIDRVITLCAEELKRRIDRLLLSSSSG